MLDVKNVRENWIPWSACTIYKRNTALGKCIWSRLIIDAYFQDIDKPQSKVAVYWYHLPLCSLDPPMSIVPRSDLGLKNHLLPVGIWAACEYSPLYLLPVSVEYVTQEIKWWLLLAYSILMVLTSMVMSFMTWHVRWNLNTLVLSTHVFNHGFNDV